MNTQQKKKARKPSRQRMLTVSELVRSNQSSSNTVPFIRLSGNWLQQFGFEPQQKIVVNARKGMVTIWAIE